MGAEVNSRRRKNRLDLLSLLTSSLFFFSLLPLGRTFRGGTPTSWHRVGFNGGRRKDTASVTLAASSSSSSSSSFVAVVPAPDVALSAFGEESQEGATWAAAFEQDNSDDDGAAAVAGSSSSSSSSTPLALRASFTTAMAAATTRAADSNNDNDNNNNNNNDDDDDNDSRDLISATSAKDQPVAVARLVARSSPERGMLDRIRSVVPKEMLEENHAAVLTAVDAAVLSWLRYLEAQRSSSSDSSDSSDSDSSESGSGSGPAGPTAFEDLLASADMHVGPMLKSRGFVDLDIDRDFSGMGFAQLSQLGGASGSIPSQRAHLGLAIECYKSLLAGKAKEQEEEEEQESSAAAGVLQAIKKGGSGVGFGTAAIITGQADEQSAEDAGNKNKPEPSSSVSLTSPEAVRTAEEILARLKAEPPPPPPPQAAEDKERQNAPLEGDDGGRDDDGDDGDGDDNEPPPGASKGFSFGVLGADSDPWAGSKIH